MQVRSAICKDKDGGVLYHGTADRKVGVGKGEAERVVVDKRKRPCVLFAGIVGVQHELIAVSLDRPRRLVGHRNVKDERKPVLVYQNVRRCGVAVALLKDIAPVIKSVLHGILTFTASKERKQQNKGNKQSRFLHKNLLTRSGGHFPLFERRLRELSCIFELSISAI